MHVVLVGPEREENLSLRYLAVALRQAGHTASLARFDSPEHLDSVVEQVRREQPGLVGLSMVFQTRAREFYELARALRQAAYPGHITAGGHFATFAYEAILRDVPELDSIARHEGEQTIVELAEALERGAGREELAGIPGMVVRGPQGEPFLAPPRRQVDDLDTLPFPARDTPPAEHLGVPTAHLVSSRGCYASCDYCCIHSWHKAASGRRYRLRSAENVAAEMALLYHERGVRNFVFHDDNFFLPTAAASRKRFEALRAAVRARGLDGIGLVLKLRPNDCDRENLLILQDIGLMRVFIGIENASPRQLKSLGRDVTTEDLQTGLDLLGELGIYCAYNMLLFEPDTTPEDLAANIRFLRRNVAHPFNWCRVEVYAGTALEQRCLEEGLLRGDYLNRGYEMKDPRVQLMFELLLPAIYDRNFACEGLSNHNIGLGYYRQLLKHFYPGRSAPDLWGRVQGVIEAVNGNAVDLLARTHDFVHDVDLSRRQEIDRFGAELRRDAFQAEQGLTRRLDAALAELDGLAEAPPAAIRILTACSRYSRRGLLAGVGAALLWVLSGCGHPHQPPPPPDPLPPPAPDPPPSPMDRPRPAGQKPPIVPNPPPPLDKRKGGTSGG